MIHKLERRFGRYAIPRLMNYVIGGYMIGYLIYLASMMTHQPLILYLTLDPRLILRGVLAFGRGQPRADELSVLQPCAYPARAGLAAFYLGSVSTGPECFF